MPPTSKQVGQTIVTRWISKLRFPQLFTFTAALFFVDFLVPDLVPFIDEILLAAATLLLANLKNEPKGDGVGEESSKPAEKDVTPPRA